VLRWIPFVYLAVVIFFAGWGLPTVTSSGRAIVLRRFLICEWDPFIGIFRLSGSFHMLAIGAGFLLVGMFYGRPYCRWLCPYGGLLSILSRVSWKNVTVTPDKETYCGMCADACPYGAIHDYNADRATCVSCARCYECCPREIVRLRHAGIPAKRYVIPPGGRGPA
jgi:polyferredoxin